MKLYKYTYLQYIPSFVENGIYASHLDKVNDPFEGTGIRYPNDYRVVCMTASPYKMLMWAYYGNHRGCCIGFDVDEIKGIRKVEYIKKFLAHEEMDTQEVIDSLYYKGNEWRHEREYRLVYHKSNDGDKIWKIDGEDVYLRASVKKIIFGYTAEKDDEYAKILEYIVKFNGTHDAKIEVTKCRLQCNQYRLVADRQFDINTELNSISDRGMMPVERCSMKRTDNKVVQAIIDSGESNLTVQELSKILGLSSKAVVKLLKKGIESGEIESIGSAQNKRYRCRSNPG